MKFQKKGQGISLNVIIIAAIALVVLVILIAIFSGKMGDWVAKLSGEETKYCGEVPDGEIGSTVGGEIVSASAGCGQDKIQTFGAFKDVTVNKICCVDE